MLKWIKPAAMSLILTGLLLAGLYVLDLRRSAVEAERIRELRAQSIEAVSKDRDGEQVSPDTSVLPETALTEPSVTSATPGSTEAPTSSQTSDPFENLRNPLPTVEKSPLAELQTINSDLIGWIRIADTRIDYPIVKGRDNIFYLSHGFNRRSSQAGAIFMDFRNIGDGNDANTIIYGHKMKDQSMFQTLLKFGDARFYANHRTIEIDTLYGRQLYRVFAAYTTNTDFYYIQTSFDQASHATFMDDIRKRSEHAWDTDITFDDRILTLSTCSNDFRDARFVVHAKRIG